MCKAVESCNARRQVSPCVFSSFYIGLTLDVFYSLYNIPRRLLQPHMLHHDMLTSGKTPSYHYSQLNLANANDSQVLNILASSVGERLGYGLGPS